mgnify:CR=1 FL=1
MQIFYINKDSVLPSLRLCLVNDGKYGFLKTSYYNNAIQNADVTFTMWDEHDVLRISKAPCNIVLVNKGSCDETYAIEYQWKKRDTKEKGQYKGRFEIIFKGDLYQEGETYEKEGQNLIMPIYEELEIFVK